VKDLGHESDVRMPSLIPHLRPGLPTRLLRQNSFFLASGAHLSVQGSESVCPRNAPDHWVCQNEVKDLGLLEDWNPTAAMLSFPHWPTVYTRNSPSTSHPLAQG